LAIFSVEEHKVLQFPLPQSSTERARLKMQETAVSFASQHVLPKFLEAIKMVRDLRKEVAEVTDELENIQDFIHEASKVAEAGEDNSRRDRIRKRCQVLRRGFYWGEQH